MKTKITLLRMLFIVLCCTMFGRVGKAQDGVSFLLSNDVQTSPTELEFDVYMISTFPGTFQLAGHQYNIAYNNAMKGAGVMTAAWVAGTSQLTNAAQLQNTINLATAGQIRLAGTPAPSCGPGSIIATAPGTRIGRMRLTNSVPWASVTPNLVFNLVTISPRTSANYYTAGCVNTPFCVTGVSIPSCLNLTTTVYSSTLANAVLNAPSCTAPTLSASAVAATCAGGADGSIDLTTTGGNPTPFTFAWSNGASSEDLSGLSAGTYTVTVTTQSGGCSATASYTVADGAPNVTYYADADGDSYGDPLVSQVSCTGAPVGFVADNTDCNDGNAAVNPGAAEVCNGIDDNCNGLVDDGLTFQDYYVDGDGDGYGAGAPTSSCNPIPGSVTNNGDCDDNNSLINPLATEVCNNIDDNCNGLVDDGLTFQDYYVDGDGDGYGAGAPTSSCNPIPGSVTNNGDCDDNNSLINPLATEVCNGIDDDCDGLTDEGLTSTTYYADADGDTYGNPAVSQTTCSGAPVGYVIDNTDCNDANAAINPGATEVCNGIDDDCDGLTDEGLTPTTYYADADGDNYGDPAVSQTTCSGAPVGYVIDNTDCNDANAAINPGAAEVCNGIDDNCNGLADDGLTFVAYYADVDGDTYGDATNSQSTCNGAPAGFVADNTDCNDANSAINPGATEVCNGIDDDCDGTADDGLTFVTYYADADGDTYGDPLTSQSTCNGAPAGYVSDNTDCNDVNPTINPGATEVCNGIDDNCNGTADEGITYLDYYVDGDGDGYGAGVATSSCVAIPGSVLVAGDCDDINPAINPGATEQCNGIDDNCNGLVDDGVVFLNYYVDGDGDGYGAGAATSSCSAIPGSVLVAGDCDDNNAAINPGATEVCNGIDDDCNGLSDDGLTFLTYYVDADGDGFGDQSATGVSSCFPIPGSVTNNGDCDDAAFLVNPAASEQCNGVDDNCDGLIDNGVVFSTWYADADGDTYGNAAVSQSACAQPVGYVLDATDCNDANAAVNPGAAEVCNLIDDDCDGLTDEGVTSTFYADTDGDSYGDASSTTQACSAPVGYVSDNTDCNDANAAVNPGATEVCNSIDDDCDGSVDEGVTLTFYADADGDTYGDASNSTQACSAPAGFVADNTDCNDANASVNPGATEVCNLIDDDCDGLIDEGVQSSFYADVDADGYGDPANSVMACTAPFGYVTDASDCDDGDISINPAAAEICGNLIDDNCNGSIDEGCGCVNPPTANAGSDQTICQNASATLNGSIGGGATNGTWSTAGDGSFSPSNTVLNASYTPGPADILAGSVVLTLTTDAPVSCTPATSNVTINIAANLPSPGAISGPATLCNPNNLVINYSIAPVAGATSYTWSVPGATVIVSGQGTTSISVRWPFSAIHAGVVGNICVSANSSGVGCGSSSPSCLGISVQLATPVTPPSISGPAKACPADVAIYSIAPVTRADVYNWTVPAGATITGGLGTNTIQVTYSGGFTGGQISVTASNACGTSPVRTRNVSLNILPASASISGPASGVCGSTLVSYTATAVVGAASYLWTVPAGATIMSGQGTATIEVDFTNSFTIGAISVLAQNGCGNGAARSLTVTGAPGQAAPITGSSALCANQNYVYDVPTIAGAVTYTWTVPSGFVINSGQGTKTIDVKAGPGAASGLSISVRASNACGTGPSRVKNGISITICPRIGEGAAMNIVAYPNPASDLLNVSFDSDKNQDVLVTMMDAAGRVVLNDNRNADEGTNKFEVSVNGMASGIYTLSLRTEDAVQMIRVVVE
jgi:hypothetical protein